MGYKHKILFIEDDRDFYRLATLELAGGGLEFEPALAADRASVTSQLQNFAPDLIISDYHLPDIEGPELLKMARASAPAAFFIVLSGVVSDQKGLELEKLGAFKYLPKDRLGRLPLAVKAALHRLSYERPRILFVENDPDDYKLELKALDEEGIKYLARLDQTREGFARELELFSPDIVISDYILPGFTALDVLGIVREKAPLTPVLVASGSVGEEKAIELFRAGAADFVLKDNIHRLGLSVARTIAALRVSIKKEEVERGLREAVEARMIILNAVKAPFFLADDKGRVLLGNAAASAALGLPELEGADIFSAEGDYCAAIKTFLLACARTGAPLVTEHKSGSLICETHVYPVAAAKGERPGFTVLSLDISEKLALRDQAASAQRLESLGLLAGGVAHDFNNIIGAIMGYAGFLYSSAKEDQFRQDAKEILNAAEKAGALTRQLLLFSKKQPMESSVFALNDAVKDMSKMLGRLLGENIRVDLELDGGPTLVKADRGRVEQVLMNLAVNARDAMPGGGKLKIKTGRAEFGPADCAGQPERRPGSYLTLAVKDSGTGMDAETLKKIFEPFFTTKGVAGNGLGLSVVYGVARQHGGFIEVASAPGSGSEFSVYFPEAGVPLEESPKPAAPSCAGTDSCGTILVLEDEEALMKIATRLLQSRGYTVLAARDAAEAAAHFRARGREINLVFSDVMLPGKSGVEFMLETLAAYQGLPFIFSSGYSDEHSEFEVIKAHGCRFLWKPCKPEDLLAAISEELEKVRK